MTRFTLLLGAMVVLAAPSFAVEDPVAVRKAFMQSVGAAAGVSGGMMKGEIAYSPVVGKAAIAAMNASALAYGDLFPEGTESDERSAAAPKIWEDRAAFDAELAKFQAAVAAASESAGREGFADLAAFTAGITPVFDSCKTCHESFQIKK